MKETLFVSFSGGRTSAYMSKWLLDNKSDEYNLIFVFANTGLEIEGTLEFVHKCDKEWGLNLVWLEAKVNPELRAKIEFNQVTFETASRNGEPFRALCEKFGVPNPDRPFCSDNLKKYVINAYKASLGFKRKHLTAIGIRADEADRMNFDAWERGEVIYPLIRWKHTTKADVMMFFQDNDFDLEIDELHGNCVTCVKKSLRHLMTIAKHNPEFFDFNIEMEEKYGHIKNASGEECKPDDPYRFFRQNNSALDIIASSKKPFTEFDPTMKEFQLSFDIDPLDEVGDCGASCEAF